MSTIVIHGIPGSPYLRMPLLACEEKGVPYIVKAMKFGADEHKQPAYLKTLHPFGRFPAMEHNDFRLYEAAAIIRYIDRGFPGPSLTPADPKAAARMDQVMNIVDWYVHPSISGKISFNRVVKPIFGMPVDEAAVAEGLPLARTCVAALKDILADQRYFAGDQVSLADLMAAAHLEFLPLSPEGADMLDGSPLRGWLERMAARPSMQKTTMRTMMNLPEPAAA